MTLTVCVGASGSGKTTFLNDVHKSHKCTYIRQYHNLRPYIKVSSIPNFDPTELPYWEIYEKEKKASSIIVGGTIAGQFMPGLSGGQRQLLIFELIFQRTSSQQNLLIVLDEPFAGVTDDFVPFIVDRLNEMRLNHNILLVTNDHVDTLKEMADNTVTVSAIDRTTVKINNREGVDRNLALLAMSIGEEYAHKTDNNDIQFFANVELSSSGGIPGVAAFTVFAYGLFLATFWNSQPGSEPLILIASGMISFFSINPYLIPLPAWRMHMIEEAEALLHTSKSMNRSLKTWLTLFLIFMICLVQYGAMNVVMVGSFSGFDYFAAVLFDNLSWMLAPICLGLYTDLPLDTVQLLGSIPFLLMIFFSTTFSPGAGVPLVKSLRYLFSRYYLFCMTNGMNELMEGCLESYNLLYLILSNLLIVFVFILIKWSTSLKKRFSKKEEIMSRQQTVMSMEYAELQLDLFQEKALEKFRRVSTLDISFLEESYRSSGHDFRMTLMAEARAQEAA